MHPSSLGTSAFVLFDGRSCFLCISLRPARGGSAPPSRVSTLISTPSPISKAPACGAPLISSHNSPSSFLPGLSALFNPTACPLHDASPSSSPGASIGQELPLNLGEFQPPEVEDDLVARAAGAAVGLQQAVVGVGLAAYTVALGDSFDEHARIDYLPGVTSWRHNQVRERPTLKYPEIPRRVTNAG